MFTEIVARALESNRGQRNKIPSRYGLHEFPLATSVTHSSVVTSCLASSPGNAARRPGSPHPCACPHCKRCRWGREPRRLVVYVPRAFANRFGCFAHPAAAQFFAIHAQNLDAASPCRCGRAMDPRCASGIGAKGRARRRKAFDCRHGIRRDREMYTIELLLLLSPQ